MSSTSAYILVFHGSHDPRSQRAAVQLTEQFRQKIWVKTHYSVMIADAYLDCHPLSLFEQIRQLLTSVAPGYEGGRVEQWRIIPVFLLAGRHVVDDLPAAIASVQAALPDSPRLHLTAHLGSHPGIHCLLAQQMMTLPMATWILVAHGSRRLEANRMIERLAVQLGTEVAYWSISPSLTTRVQEVVQLGVQHIGILPYFLFSGGITDAIAETVAQMVVLFPEVMFHMAPPLETDFAHLADLLVDLALQPETVLV